MTMPYIRARAKDNVDALDNVTAYLDPSSRREIAEYVASILADIEQVIAHATKNGIDPGIAFAAFVEKFNEYWKTPAD
jgi:hypothetical protein